ncbi:MAG: VOC family protein [Halolamina sp.]
MRVAADACGMDVTAIDHVNLTLPADRVDEAVAFYEGTLGFPAETLEAYRAGETSLLTFRLADDAVIHTRPSESFTPPAEADADRFGHTCLRVPREPDDLQRELEAADVAVDAVGERRGATGVATSVYVVDPFGYRWELKAVGD